MNLSTASRVERAWEVLSTVLDPEVVAQLIGRRTDPLASLTPREREVLALMGEGRTNAAISSALFIGTGAVEKNVTSIFQKLGLDDSGTDHRRVLAVLAWLQRCARRSADPAGGQRRAPIVATTFLAVRRLCS